MLNQVYEDNIINGPGGDLDNIWCQRWRKLVAEPAKSFDVIGGHIGRKLIDILIKEIQLLSSGQMPSDRLHVFLRVLTQKVNGVKGWKEIRRVIQRRLEDWEEGNIEKLIQETLRASISLRSNINHNQAKSTNEEHTQRVFCRLIWEGKVRAAVRFLAERDKGGVLHPDDMIEVKGKNVRVRDVLIEQHPDPQEPRAAAMSGYSELPELPAY